MEESRKEKMEKLQRDFQKLPSKWQIAICWVVENWEPIEASCKDTTMTNEEIEQTIKEARAKGDVSMEILARLAKQFRETKE